MSGRLHLDVEALRDGELLATSIDNAEVSASPFGGLRVLGRRLVGELAVASAKVTRKDVVIDELGLVEHLQLERELAARSVLGLAVAS